MSIIKLIIGGIANGKLDYIKKLGYSDNAITDCSNYSKDKLSEIKNYAVIYKLNALIKMLMECGENPSEFVQKLIVEAKIEVIACDEVGAGIVPLERADRDYREAVGRICCEIAKQADEVVRVYCGVPNIIKN